MKVAVLGAKRSPCAEPIDQMVVPVTGLPSPSAQVNAVPPHSWTERWVILQIQSLLKVLDSLTPESQSFPLPGEPEDFEVYDDETYRYVSLKLPENSGHEIDLNINDGLMFVRIAL